MHFCPKKSSLPPYIFNAHVGRREHVDLNGLPFKLRPIEIVETIVGMKRSAIHAKVAKGTFPAPIKFGTSRRAAARWIEQEIVDYIAAQAANRQHRA